MKKQKQYNILKIKKFPEANFGTFGGMFVPETLIAPLQSLTDHWQKIRRDKTFWKNLDDLYQHYVGRPTPLYRARRLEAHFSKSLKKSRIYLKREDLCHTGAHKINNALGQALLAVCMGKTRIIAETGAGQHGVATATACALLGLSCDIFMGSLDIERQAPNVQRMKMLGANLIPVNSGSCTLKDALNEALRNWVATVRHTHYIIGSVAGPSPFPAMVRDFQSVISKEARSQILRLEKRLPDFVMACVGGGSNAMGIFAKFIADRKVGLIGIEAGGNAHGHSASLGQGQVGILHGSKSLVLQNADGQILEAHSIAPGLDYPGVGPQLAFLKETGRLRVGQVNDEEALDAFFLLARTEGIIPALESSHAIAYLRHLRVKKPSIIVINLSGRGDKDLAAVEKVRGLSA